MKFSLLRFLWVSSIFIIGINGFSQTQLTGRVTDFMSFQPIENASVYIENTTIGTITNKDGKFSLRVPEQYEKGILIISSIGYSGYKIPVSEFEDGEAVFLEEEIASLDEVVVEADSRPKTGNDVVKRAVERLPKTMPDTAYLQKGFLRHRERNKNQYKWLIEAAITIYDTDYGTAKNNLKINVDEIRKSYDLRDVDSLFTYSAFLKSKGNNTASGNINRSKVSTESLVEAIKWNDERISGLNNLFKGKLNPFRNADAIDALFGKNMLAGHQFSIQDTLVENGRKIYKIKINKGEEFVGLNTPGIYNEGFQPQGWLYIFYDNFAIKKLEYELIAASDVQKRRSKSLFDTQILHKLIINYRDYEDKMYPNYMYYETPKLVNTGDRSSDRERTESAPGFDKGEQYYYTIQEILFTDIIEDSDIIANELQTNSWSADIFSPQPYHPEFWKNYNVLLESEEESKLIHDLTQRATLFKE